MSDTPAPPRPLAAAASLELDDLLAELRRRADGARRLQARLAGLLDAVVDVSGALDLPTVLRRAVEATCGLVGATYGAIGVLDDSGHGVRDFVTHGLSPQQCARIPGPPRGRGIIGELIARPGTHRLAEITDHPSFEGFPGGHPVMHAFLGTTLLVRGRVYGNLYVMDRADGAPFAEDDETLIEAMAAATGVAIENALLYRRAQACEEWAHAVGELTQTLLEGRNERSALARMAKRAREMGNAELGVVAVRDAGGSLVAQAVERRDGAPTELLGATLQSPYWDILLRKRVPVQLLAMPEDQHAGLLAAQLVRDAGLTEQGTTVIAPIAVGEEDVGLISLTWTSARREEAAETMVLLTSFAGQMGLAIEAGRAQRQRARAALLEDRDRIARDMHDHVIQRLFATGLSLHTVARQCETGPVKDRVEDAVDELGGAVRDIRQAIFELHHHLPEGGLGPATESLVAQAATTFGFVPDLAIEGLLSDVPPDLEQDVVAVVREGLANIGRHAGATDAQVHVSALGDLVVTIQDDGRGVPRGAARGGLVNLDERARARGGTFSVARRRPTGTTLRWRVPLP